MAESPPSFTFGILSDTGSIVRLADREFLAFLWEEVERVCRAAASVAELVEKCPKLPMLREILPRRAPVVCLSQIMPSIFRQPDGYSLVLSNVK